MVSIYSERASLNDAKERIYEFRGLSTDTKPTEDVGNGSTYVCTDNGDIYMFDGTNNTWNKIS